MTKTISPPKKKPAARKPAPKKPAPQKKAPPKKKPSRKPAKNEAPAPVPEPPTIPADLPYEVKYLRLSEVTWDPRLQVREKLDEDAVERYAERYADGAEMGEPSCVQEGEIYWVADGWHRGKAAPKAGIEALPFRVYQGDFALARLLSRLANKPHDAVPMKRVDLQRSVRCAIEDDAQKGAHRSDPALAEECGVHHRTVRAERRRAALEQLRIEPDVTDEDLARLFGLRAEVDFEEIREAHLAGDETVPAAMRPQGKPQAQAAPQQADEGDETPLEPAGEDLPADEHARAHDERQKRIDRAKAEDEKHKKPPVLDGLNREVPSHLRDAFASAAVPDLIAELQRQAEEIDPKAILRRARDLIKAGYAYLRAEDCARNARESKEALSSAAQALTDGLPFAVCPACDGAPDGCDECRKTGCVPQWRYRELTGKH